MDSIDSSSQPTHPYVNLPISQFWKTAIADIDVLNIENLWKPKFRIAKDAKVITLGSCFAQHIGKALKSHGFNWLDAEPAPSSLAAELHAENGYGVFSFRTGNIYSAALLKQWFYWAIGRVPQNTEVFVEKGRYYDPFRPTIPMQGYESPDALFQARETTLRAIAGAITQADILIFTLGLTEAWQNSLGDTYPMCPGTIRGEYSAESHLFHNFQYEEIVADLIDLFDELHTRNPKIRFLLTVSPVPLTATASQDHVLSANMYSKSVLRAVAGFLARTRDDVDYFPSYELVSSPPYRGQFFERNMRSVTPEGVDFVMSQFYLALGMPAAIKRSIQAVVTTVPASVEKIASSSGDAICEDILLESWSKGTRNLGSAPPNLVLIGDSHMAKIANVLDERGIAYAGGAIMQGSQWHDLEFVMLDDAIFTPVDEAAKARWEDTWQKSFARYEAATNGERWIITNIGSHTNTMATETGFFAYLMAKYSTIPSEIQMADVRTYLTGARMQHINIVRKFVNAGYKVVWVSDPPTQVFLQEMLTIFDSVLLGYFKAAGCSIFNAREWVNRLGEFPAEFRSSELNPDTGQLDVIHGSLEYYRQLLNEIFRVNGIRTGIE